MPQYVFINGERMELLEDRRFCMQPRFSEGTRLFDPSTTPAKLVPLSTETEDHGVTTRKLVPNRHYFARNTDGTPAHIALKFLIIHNVPLNTTARELGQFFENYSQVVEADVLRWAPGTSKGRGYVTLQSHEAMVMLAKEKSIYFDPYDVFLFIEPSDRHPAQLSHGSTHFQAPPLPPPGYSDGNMGAPSSAAGPPMGGSSLGVGGPPPPASSSFLQTNKLGPSGGTNYPPRGGLGPGANPGHHGASHGGNNLAHGGGHHAHGHHHHGGGHPVGGGAGGKGGSNSNNNQQGGEVFYFVDRIKDEDVSYSHAHGVFWPVPQSRKEYLAAAQKGTAYICFLLMNSVRNDAYLYGYGRVLYPQPNIEGARLRGEVYVEWILIGANLDRRMLQERLGVNVVGMSEGTPIKGDLGQSIIELIELSPGCTPPPPQPKYIQQQQQQATPAHPQELTPLPRTMGTMGPGGKKGGSGGHQHHQQQGGQQNVGGGKRGGGAGGGVPLPRTQQGPGQSPSKGNNNNNKQAKASPAQPPAQPPAAEEHDDYPSLPVN